MPDELQTYIDKDLIRDVLYTYCRAIDRSDMNLLRSLVLPDAPFDLGIFCGPALAFADFAESFLTKVGPTHHNITNVLISINGATARSESYCIAMHSEIGGQDGAVDLISYFRYLDRFEKQDGVWKIASRTVAHDWNQNITGTFRWDGPMHGSFLPRGARGENDISYPTDKV